MCADTLYSGLPRCAKEKQRKECVRRYPSRLKRKRIVPDNREIAGLGRGWGVLLKSAPGIARHISLMGLGHQKKGAELVKESF